MIIAFISGFLLDLAWAYYTRQVAAGAAVLAALTSIVTGGLGAIGVAGVVRDADTLPAYLAGLALGTYMAVRWTR